MPKFQKLKAPQISTPPTPRTDKVLIIDDDLTIKVMFEDILHAHDYQTFHALNSREGVRFVKEHLPDIILLDIAIPAMNGLGTCQAIRNIDLPTRPSIIMVSNKGDKEAIQALEKGADDFITKPVDDAELIAKIKAQSRIKSFYQELHKNKKPIVVEDIPRHPLMAEVKNLVKDLEKMNVLVLPIVWEEEVVGTLFLRTHRLDKGFTDKEIKFCQIIANSAYHAVKNATLFEEKRVPTT